MPDLGLFGLDPDAMAALGTAGDEDELIKRRMAAAQPPPSSMGPGPGLGRSPASMLGGPRPPGPSPTPAPTSGPAPPTSPVLGRHSLVTRAPAPDSEIEPGPQQQRLAGMMQQPEPQLHGWRRVLDTVGQIAAPGIEARIPGTPGDYRMQLGRQMTLAGEEDKAQSAVLGRRQKAADITLSQAQAEKAISDPTLKEDHKPEDLAYQYLTKAREEGGGGETPIDAFKHVREAGVTRPDQQPKITYDQGIPVTVTGPKGTYDINDPAMPPEYQPLVKSARTAHNQARGERVEDMNKTQGFAAAQQQRVFGQQQQQQQRTFEQQERERQARDEQLTGSTKTMVEQAPKVKAFIARLEPMIDQLNGQLGPAAGRWNSFWTGKVGLADPKFKALQADYGLLTTLLMRMHVGARGGEYIMGHFDKMLNAGKEDPKNMKAALQEISRYADDLIAEGQGRIGAPAGRTPKPGEPVSGGGGPQVQTQETRRATHKWNPATGKIEAIP